MVCGPMDRQVNSVNYMITTYCDRLCPQCCCNMPTAKRVHYDVDSVEQAAQHFQGLRWLQVTGGEPSLHPQFQRVSQVFRERYKPKRLTLASNGSNLLSHLQALDLYDEVRIARYDENSYAGSEDNEDLIREILRQYDGPARIVIQGQGRPSRHKTGSPDACNPCRRGFIDLVAFQDNRVYACCVACGIPGAGSVPLTPSWREDVLQVPLPCAACVFGEP